MKKREEKNNFKKLYDQFKMSKISWQPILSYHFQNDSIRQEKLLEWGMELELNIPRNISTGWE